MACEHRAQRVGCKVGATVEELIRDNLSACPSRLILYGEVPMNKT